MNNPNGITRLKHFDSLASYVNVLGSVSSTVDGGLWYGVTDGLPVVKMNQEGGEFLIDTKPAEDALIGNKLYLGGHRFQLAGFADGLTFSDNNFYVGGNSTPIGSVSSFAFQFTDAGALNVAEGGTISITQLDTDAVDFTLDLDSLNGEATPWRFNQRSTYDVPVGTEEYTGVYTYTTTPSANSYKRSNATTYTYSQPTSADPKTLTLDIADDLKPRKSDGTDEINGRNLSRNSYSAKSFEHIVKVDEIYNAEGTLTEFVVNIMSDDAFMYDFSGNGNKEPIAAINAYCDDTSVKVTVKFASNLSLSDNGVEEEATLIRDKDEGGIDKGTYTYTSEQYVVGYKIVDGTSQNLVKYKLAKPTTHPYVTPNGDKCTIEGLATSLKLYRIGEEDDAIKYNIYAGDTYNAENIVGYTHGYGVVITDARALDIPPAAKSGQVPFAIKLGTSNLHLELSSALTSANEAVAEGFTRQSDGSYKYHVGSTGWQFKSSSIYQTPGDITIKPAEVIGIEGLNLVIRGLTLTDPELFVTLSSGSNSAANVTRENGEIVCSINYNATAPSSPTLTGADAADFTLTMPS